MEHPIVELLEHLTRRCPVCDAVEWQPCLDVPTGGWHAARDGRK